MKDLPEVLKHNYITQTQAQYYKELKTSISQKEYLVCLDFAENYTCIIQDAIQAFHWSAKQATLHPYVIYYKKNNEVKNKNYVVISERVVTHDADCVHLFNGKLVSYLKSQFGSENVKKIFYFSDGAGSQYKNKSNFVNLTYHETDFNVEAEWHFFASAHGKGPCDGIGGTVKRHARKASLQAISGHQIKSAKSLFDWAVSYFKKIDFGFCSETDHKLHDTKLKSRYSSIKPIANTRQYHSFRPINKNEVSCKIVSNHSVSVTGKLTKKSRK